MQQNLPKIELWLYLTNDCIAVSALLPFSHSTIKQQEMSVHFDHLMQLFSNFFDYGPLFSSGIVRRTHTCYSKIYCKILKFLGTLLSTNKRTSSIIYKLQWKASNVSVMDVLASLCTDCQKRTKGWAILKN